MTRLKPLLISALYPLSSELVAKFHEYFIRRNFRLGVPEQISVGRAKRTVAKYTRETERNERPGKTSKSLEEFQREDALCATLKTKSGVSRKDCFGSLANFNAPQPWLVSNSPPDSSLVEFCEKESRTRLCSSLNRGSKDGKTFEGRAR